MYIHACVRASSYYHCTNEPLFVHFWINQLSACIQRALSFIDYAIFIWKIFLPNIESNRWISIAARGLLARKLRISLSLPLSLSLSLSTNNWMIFGWGNVKRRKRRKRTRDHSCIRNGIKSFQSIFGCREYTCSGAAAATAVVMTAVSWVHVCECLSLSVCRNTTNDGTPATSSLALKLSDKCKVPLCFISHITYTYIRIHTRARVRNWYTLLHTLSYVYTCTTYIAYIYIE